MSEEKIAKIQFLISKIHLCEISKFFKYKLKPSTQCSIFIRVTWPNLLFEAVCITRSMMKFKLKWS
jgi:hypothetical protein